MASSDSVKVKLEREENHDFGEEDFDNCCYDYFLNGFNGKGEETGGNKSKSVRETETVVMRKCEDKDKDDQKIKELKTNLKVLKKNIEEENVKITKLKNKLEGLTRMGAMFRWRRSKVNSEIKKRMRKIRSQEHAGGQGEMVNGKGLSYERRRRNFEARRGRRSRRECNNTSEMRNPEKQLFMRTGTGNIRTEGSPAVKPRPGTDEMASASGPRPVSMVSSREGMMMLCNMTTVGSRLGTIRPNYLSIEHGGPRSQINHGLKAQVELYGGQNFAYCGYGQNHRPTPVPQQQNLNLVFNSSLPITTAGLTFMFRGNQGHNI